MIDYILMDIKICSHLSIKFIMIYVGSCRYLWEDGVVRARYVVLMVEIVSLLKRSLKKKYIYILVLTIENISLCLKKKEE